MNYPHVRNNFKDTSVSILADDRSGICKHYIDFFLTSNNCDFTEGNVRIFVSLMSIILMLKETQYKLAIIWDKNN